MRMTAPFFSILMPVYNCAPYIEDAISSALAQSFGDFELLVGDDGSTDGTREVVERIAVHDPRVRLFHREAGLRGPGANRNRLLTHVRADWIKFLDGDDLWPTEHLDQCRQAISRFPDAAIFFGDYRRFWERPEDAGELCVEGKVFFDPEADYVEEVTQSSAGIQLFRLRSDRLLRFCCLFYCPISTSSVTLSAPIVRERGLRFPENWLGNSDFDFWMQMLESGPAVALRHLLYYYRVNPTSVTSNVIHYCEGMAKSHGKWMHRTWARLTAEDRRIYLEKVSGFLQSAGWEHSRRGHIGPAAWAELRAAWVLPTPSRFLAVTRTTARAALWRLRGVRGRKAT